MHLAVHACKATKQELVKLTVKESYNF